MLCAACCVVFCIDAVVLSYVECCRGLQHLDVSSNQLQAATCAALGHVISNGCHLQNLRLDQNPLGKQVLLIWFPRCNRRSSP